MKKVLSVKHFIAIKKIKTIVKFLMCFKKKKKRLRKMIKLPHILVQKNNN